MACSKMNLTDPGLPKSTSLTPADCERLWTVKDDCEGFSMNHPHCELFSLVQGHCEPLSMTLPHCESFAAHEPCTMRFDEDRKSFDISALWGWGYFAVGVSTRLPGLFRLAHWSDCATSLTFRFGSLPLRWSDFRQFFDENLSSLPSWSD